MNKIMNMKKFEFIDITTADVAFIAYGNSLNELFENAALAMFEVMINTKKVKKREKREINEKGIDLESLMFNWLNDLLYYYGAEGLVFSDFKVNINLKNYTLNAIAFGEEVDPLIHEVKIEVKAATYHLLKIWKEKNLWKARVILDI